MSDPYSFGAMDLRGVVSDLRLGLAVTDPRAHVKVERVSDPWPVEKFVLWVLRDPAKRWARSWRQFGRQLVDIVRFEFWMAARYPERTPGAVRMVKRDVGAG